MIVTLWFIRESASGQARLFSRVPSSAKVDGVDDNVWLPRSLIEHASKDPVKPGEDWPAHTMTIPDWIGVQKGL